jgi:hypothetical protein
MSALCETTSEQTHLPSLPSGKAWKKCGVPTHGKSSSGGDQLDKKLQHKSERCDFTVGKSSTLFDK